MNTWRDQKVHHVVESANLSKMIEAYKNLYCKTTTGRRDTSRSRTVQFHKLCWEYFASDVSIASMQVGVDQLFKDYVARRRFRKFLKFGGSISVETSLSVFIIFDAIITDAIDSFGTILETSRLPERSLIPISNEHVCSSNLLIISKHRADFATTLQILTNSWALQRAWV